MVLCSDYRRPHYTLFLQINELSLCNDTIIISGIKLTVYVYNVCIYCCIHTVVISSGQVYKHDKKVYKGLGWSQGTIIII